MPRAKTIIPKSSYCRKCDAAVAVEGEWPARCAQCSSPIEEDPVPSVIGPEVRLLFIGINPGIETARVRHHFAFKRNAFWPLLFDSGLTPVKVDPKDDQSILKYGLGITNIVTRATPSSSDIRQKDIEYGLSRLEEVLSKVSPRVVAFVGIQSYKMTTGEKVVKHGLQAKDFHHCKAFVLPSTSPANASLSYNDKLFWFKELKNFLDSESKK